MGAFEITEGSSSLGMDNTFRNPLTVKVSQLVDQDMILQVQTCRILFESGIIVILPEAGLVRGVQW